MVAQPQTEPVTLGRVIVASDDAQLRRELLQGLALDGPWTVAARPLQQAVQLASGAHTDTILVIDLRGADLGVMQELRSSSDALLLAITDPTGTGAALDHGADDAVGWPCPDGELAGRLRGAHRRHRPRPQSPVLEGPLSIRMFPRAHEAFVADQPLNLTPKEFMVLMALIEHRGEVLTADDLSRDLWGHETFGARNFVEAHISRLRQKLKAAGTTEDIITTIRGVGYKIR